MSLIDDDSNDVGRAIVGMAPATDDEKAARVSYRDRLIQFFETGDLYRKYPLPETGPKRRASMQGSWIEATTELPVPTNLRISAMCDACGGTKTFATDFGPQYDDKKGLDLRVGETRMLQFRCTHCEKQRLAFLVHVGRTGRTPESQLAYLEKAGIWPSVRPSPAPELAKGLGAAAELYSKGLTVEKFGYGIGAFAYYRRVTEDIIDRLLAQLREYADENEQPKLVKAIDATATETQASKKIAAVKDLVPMVLRRGTMNPLGTMYASLSDGLHGRTDEECLDRAKELRIMIEYLVTRLEALVTTPKQFEEALNKLRSPVAADLPAAPSGGAGTASAGASKRPKPGKK